MSQETVAARPSGVRGEHGAEECGGGRLVAPGDDPHQAVAMRREAAVREHEDLRAGRRERLEVVAVRRAADVAPDRVGHVPVPGLPAGARPRAGATPRGTPSAPAAGWSVSPARA